MKRILRHFEGGDRRSIRGVPEVVRRVLAEPRLFRDVVEGIGHSEPLIRMRAADAIEKISAKHPEYLRPYKAQVLRWAATVEQPQVRWHMAQLLPRLDMDARERRAAVEALNRYLTDESSIVKTFAMQALADLAARDARLRARVVEQLRELTRTGTPAMKSRGRKLLARLDAEKAASAQPRRTKAATK